MSLAVNEKIERSRAVRQIEALTGEIINITDQTTLLALNANIEAARAEEAESMIRFMNETAMAGHEMLLQNSRNYQNDVGHLSKVGKFKL